MSKLFCRFAKSDSGVTAIEYGLIVSLIALAIIGTLANDGLHLSSTFATVAASL